MIAPTSDLQVRRPLSQFVEAYQSALRDMQAGFQQACQAQRILEALVSQDGTAADYCDYRIRDVEKTEMDSLKVSAWHHLMGVIGVDKILPEARRTKMHENLHSENAPEVTIENVMELIGLLHGTDLQREALLEAFETLRPGRYSSAQHKTNKRASWKVTRRVILTGFLDTRWSRYALWTNRANQLAIADRAFHLLDGALDKLDANSYKTPLVDAVQSSETSGSGRGETDYFKFQCYANGNLHLTIKRADLLAELNRVGGQGIRAMGMEN